MSLEFNKIKLKAVAKAWCKDCDWTYDKAYGAFMGATRHAKKYQGHRVIAKESKKRGYVLR